MIKNFLIILVFVLSACNNSVQEVEIKEVEKKQIVNENLLYFDFELIKDIDVNDEKELELYELDNLKVDYFEDVMEKGDFVSYEHKHHFKAVNNGTIMIDEVKFEAPYGAVGKLFSRVYLTGYLKLLIEKRNNTIREYAESTKWQALL